MSELVRRVSLAWKISRLTCSLRHSCTRRWRVRSWAPVGYTSGNCSRSRCISAFAVTSGSVCSQPSTSDQLCANGSTRDRHQCLVAAFLRPWGGRSVFCHAVARPIEKRAEVVSGPRWRLAVAIAYSGELLLRIPNCFQQRDGIECSEPRAQLMFDHFVNIRRGQQTLIRGKRRMIAPPYQRAVTLLAGQFE